MALPDLPWVAVTGFGAHIKATPTRLVIQQKGRIDEYPLRRVHHLLIIGGHTLHSTVITTLIKNGIPVSFFEADGTPVGVIRSFGDTRENGMRSLQVSAPKHRYAVEIARGTLRSRLLAIRNLERIRQAPLLYEGELAFLNKAYEEMEYLIKLDEIRRLHRLVSDMYYEIIARAAPPELGFRRRTPKARQDPVNAMLSVSYAILYGSCMVPVLASRLDPDLGLLNEGPGSLIHDIIDPFRAPMADAAVLRLVDDGISMDEFEMSAERCIISDDLVRRLQAGVRTTLAPQRLQEQVQVLCDALHNNGTYVVLLQPSQP